MFSISFWKQRDEKKRKHLVNFDYQNKAPFTRVRTNFCSDKFCPCTSCLHGSVQILLQWCLHGSVKSLDQSRYLIPGHNRAIWAKSWTVRVFTRFRTNMEPCRSKRWPAFFRSQTCTLSRSKIRPVPPVPCKRKVEPCEFLSVQTFVRTRVNGALAVQKFVQFRRSRVNARWNRVSFCPCKDLYGPV